MPGFYLGPGDLNQVHTLVQQALELRSHLPSPGSLFLLLLSSHGWQSSDPEASYCSGVKGKSTQLRRTTSWCVCDVEADNKLRWGISGPVGTQSSISHRPIHSQEASLYHPGGSQMHGPPASASHVLGSQVDTTTLSKVLPWSTTCPMVDSKASTLFSLSLPFSPLPPLMALFLCDYSLLAAFAGILLISCLPTPTARGQSLQVVPSAVADRSLNFMV